MDSETCLELAERLRSALAHLRQTESADDSPAHRASVERAAIAHFLRENFTDTPPEDTHTLPLFSTSPHG